MRRTAFLLAAALCAAAVPSAFAAERAAVVPAVPGGIAAPSVSAPRVGAPSLAVPSAAPGLSLGSGVSSLSLPSAAPQARPFAAAAQPGVSAAARQAGVAPAAVLPGENARAASAEDFRSGAEMSPADEPAAPRAEGRSATSAISAIGRTLAGGREGSEAAGRTAPADRALSARLDRAFDGSALRSSAAEPSAVAGRESRWTSRLARSTRSLAKKAGVAAAATLLLAAPAMAQAAGAAPAAGPVMTQSVSLAWLSAIQPIAAAAGAVLGAVYGLIIARGKEDDASGGDALAAALRYGVIGGASVYMLLDLTHLAFIGPGVGLKPLSAAVATAALGRAAFQGKFSDAATTSADRVVAAFPAVAAALGLSIGVNLAAPALSYTLAMTAMAATGVAAAIYAAVFKLGRSPADGPGLMGKGFVLQSLMCGLALALTTPWQVWTFAAMGAAGFGLVLFAFARELWSLVPKRPAPPKA